MKRKYIPVRRCTSTPGLTTITKGPTQRIRIVERETMNRYLIKTNGAEKYTLFQEVAGEQSHKLNK